ncbi:Speckle-type POZ protein A-like isoform X2 [Aphelenchoides bicaudatus]|nr:Speckle-type POZ protein A-like isoform X2 [Aphelenchoides bicaudatus]
MDNDGLPNFLEVMRTIYTNEELCDIEIKTDGRSFKASKHMLRAHSSVFRAMFTNDTVERKSNVVQINEFDVELIESFLCYLHTGQHPNKATLALMFPIADYYDVAKLKTACLEALHSTLDSKNAPEYYELAERFKLDDLKEKALKMMETNLDCSTFYLYFEFASKHECTELKTKVLQFMSNNLLEVASTEDWKQLDPELRSELFQSQFKSLKSRMMPTDEELQLSVQLGVKIDASYNNGPAILTCHRRDIRLKNAGSKHLFYRIVAFTPDPAFKVLSFDNDILLPNRQNLIECFKDKDFCRLKIVEL